MNGCRFFLFFLFFLFFSFVSAGIVGCEFVSTTNSRFRDDEKTISGVVFSGTDILEIDSLPESIAVFNRGILPGEELSEPWRVFSIDIRGCGQDEIVAVNGRWMCIISLDNTRYAEYPIPVGGGIPAFAADVDMDGKHDIVFGSESMSKPEVFSVNGCGNRIAGFIERDSRLNYNRIEAVTVLDGMLLAVSRAQNPHGSRGIHAFSLPGFELEWFFPIPVDPFGLSVVSTAAGVPAMVPAYIRNNQGVYHNYGDRSVNNMNWDPQVRLYIIDGRPRSLGETRIEEAEDPLLGSVRYLPFETEDEQALMGVHAVDLDESGFGTVILFPVGLDGSPLSEPVRIEGTYVDAVIVPEARTGVLPDSVDSVSTEAATEESNMLLLLLDGPAGRRLERFRPASDNTPERIGVLPLRSGADRLGVLIDAVSGEYLFMLADGESVIGIDESGEPRVLCPDHEYESMLYYESCGEVFLLFAARGGYDIYLVNETP